MSSGELKIDGAKASYELQIPVYETQQIRDPEHTLLDTIHFYGGGAEAHILTRSCAVEGTMLVCRATYLFNADVDRLRVDCRLHTALVANHVHILHATKLSGRDAGRSDQAFFDISFPTYEMRFRPPSFWETLIRDTGSGFWRALSALASLLFLSSVLVAARGMRNLALLMAMFLIGELAASLYGPRQLSPRFLEAAAALTVAYLAIEVLLLPKAGGRWLVVGLLGAFHGLYFGLFLDAGVSSRFGFLSGVVLGEIAAVAILYGLEWVFLRSAPRVSWQWSRVMAGLLFVTGTSWFVVRMMS
ncbi:MAG TPA: HupE/UreJ family protein [Bryobacteraceae bacterium]